MNKIVFIGIILITGLFSLQYSLIGYHSSNNFVEVEDVPLFDLDSSPSNENNVQVIYICPEDTLTINRMNKAIEMLL